MGCTPSAPDTKDDREVQKELTTDRNRDKQVIKLLFLGAGGSGKTTLFKQLQYIHGGGYKDRDRKQFRSQIYEQVMENMKLMLKKIEDQDIPTEDEKFLSGLSLQDENSKSSAAFILSCSNSVELNEEIVKHLTQLWNDKIVRMIFDEWRGKICVPDSTGYFLNSLQRIIVPDYIPNDDDLLLVRYRTTGMNEKTLDIEGNPFKICDVGGQRNERRKWIHFFDNVTAVIFVVSLSGYDEVIFEDEDTNCMDESLQVFGETIELETFKDTAFILFLNKKDIFDEKILKVPITFCFEDYAGPQTSEDSLLFIRQQFEAKNANPTARQIYSHVTQATDRDQIKKVFQDVQHIVIQWSLQRSGLI